MANLVIPGVQLAVKSNNTSYEREPDVAVQNSDRRDVVSCYEATERMCSINEPIYFANTN